MDKNEAMRKQVDEIVAQLMGNGSIFSQTTVADKTHSVNYNGSIDKSVQNILDSITTPPSGATASQNVPACDHCPSKDKEEIVRRIIGDMQSKTIANAPAPKTTAHGHAPLDADEIVRRIKRDMQENTAGNAGPQGTTRGNARLNPDEILQKIMSDMQGNAKTDAPSVMRAKSSNGKLGIYDDAESAIAAAQAGYRELSKLTLAKRSELIDAIRRAGKQHVTELAQLDLDETGMGRYQDKVRKLNFVLSNTPGIESIKAETFSGDCGLTVVENLPYGVACCITPSTAVHTTPFHNAICMIAAGNSVVFCPHPNALKSTLRGIEIINQAIIDAGGPPNIINSVSRISMEITNTILSHPSINLVVATGGPSVVHKVLTSGKKAVGAGAGNPPALVDETADLANAAKCIVAGNHFENGIQCVCEKEVIVVDSVADRLIEEMIKEGAYLLKNKSDIEKLTNLVTTAEGTPNKDYLGNDPDYILKGIGIDAPKETTTIIFEAPQDHIIAVEEYLMSVLPIIRVRDADEGIALAAKLEGGRRHTAVVHSKNISVLTKFVKAVGCTVVVKNGPSFAGTGMGGEGFSTGTVAGPTGEGITSPRDFTRQQRCVLVGDFNLRGTYPL